MRNLPYPFLCAEGNVRMQAKLYPRSEYLKKKYLIKIRINKLRLNCLNCSISHVRLCLMFNRDMYVRTIQTNNRYSQVIQF